jgi:fatty-acyl-CoA synthase
MGTRHLSSWPPELPHDLPPPKTSLWANLAASASRAPDWRAVVFYDSVLGYRELERQCERLAGFLQRECGVARGDRVALYMQNSPQFVIAFYAILRADALVVPVNPMKLTGELEYMLRDSKATVMIAARRSPRTLSRSSAASRCGTSSWARTPITSSPGRS